MDVVVEPKRTRSQRASATAMAPDAPCTPVTVHAAITGRARMPRASLEIRAMDGSVVGHVSLVNWPDGMDLSGPFWLVGPPTRGSVVALVAADGSQLILPGGRLHGGPAKAAEWSDLACRMLGWQRRWFGPGAPPGVRALYADPDSSVDGPRFTEAVRRFRVAAVFLPVLFVIVCFPYLFLIPSAVRDGTSPGLLLLLPVLGGGLMTAWSAHCRVAVGEAAEAIEAGAGRRSREIAFTQSYWASMRRPTEPWVGPLPDVLVHASGEPPPAPPPAP